MGSTQFGNFHIFVKDNQPPNEKFNPIMLFRDFDGRVLDMEVGEKEGCRGEKVGYPLRSNWLETGDTCVDTGPRREFQIFLAGYIIIEICEIFTVGGFPLNDNVRKGFTAVHLAAICATTWMLFINALVGYQFLDDGTPISVGLLIASATVLFIGTGYIALDTAFSWTGHFDSSLSGENRNIGLYVLYLLFPLICLFGFFSLKTTVYLSAATLLFAIGQIFNFVISTHLCQAADGKINGALFETLFTLLSVGMIWVFWSSITEDDWPVPVNNGGYS
ncbi:conserved hypothetical protein [Uncinocarpus reesii 1704]|uniref:Uncharacterized protein n=1 Tax=Uncinocarpus reesii (strain UAMH 1704) TaxID=336963 RepID=C4JQ14_UNCRE|nr:uncharacterized protein UREG_03247 [Uncinocarpus reesii 1704]EEP78401.1 conserved hypothetical protein [Uncinocarpus reesii 1704]